MRGKLTVLLAVAVLPLLTSARELTPGTIELSGSSLLGLSTGSSKETIEMTGMPNMIATTDKTFFDFEASGLYYLTPVIGVGLDLGYSSEKSKLAPETITDSQSFIGVRAGIDVGLAEKVSFYGDASVGRAALSQELEDTSDPTANYTHDYSGIGLRLGAGIKYFVVPPVSLNAGLVYRLSSISADIAPGVKQTLRDSDFGLAVGISVYLGG